MGTGRVQLEKQIDSGHKPAAPRSKREEALPHGRWIGSDATARPPCTDSGTKAPLASTVASAPDSVAQPSAAAATAHAAAVVTSPSHAAAAVTSHAAAAVTSHAAAAVTSHAAAPPPEALASADMDVDMDMDAELLRAVLDVERGHAAVPSTATVTSDSTPHPAPAATVAAPPAVELARSQSAPPGIPPARGPESTATPIAVPDKVRFKLGVFGIGEARFRRYRVKAVATAVVGAADAGTGGGGAPPRLGSHQRVLSVEFSLPVDVDHHDGELGQGPTSSTGHSQSSPGGNDERLVPATVVLRDVWCVQGGWLVCWLFPACGVMLAAHCPVVASRACRLDSPVDEGDIIHVVFHPHPCAPAAGEVVVVSQAQNALVVLPDVLLSPTRVGAGLQCTRRAVLGELVTDSFSSHAALMGQVRSLCNARYRGHARRCSPLRVCDVGCLCHSSSTPCSRRPF